MQNGEKLKCPKQHSNFTQPTHYVCNYVNYNYMLPIPVAARSKAWVCSRSLAGTAVSSPAGDMHVCFFECRVFSGRSLWVVLITRPEDSYRLSECDSEA